MLVDMIRFNLLWILENHEHPGDSTVIFAYLEFLDSFPGTPEAREISKILGGAAYVARDDQQDTLFGDDFEDASWDFRHNFPKSSREQDSRLRSPTGRSLNDRWIEGPERGQPDYMQVVPTPAGGLAGSNYALLMQTLNSGIPGRHLNNVQQDDLIANCISRIGSISPSEIPSVVTRVYLPPADEWENRSGPHFGFRISASTITTEKSSGFFWRAPGNQGRAVLAGDLDSFPQQDESPH